MKKWIYDESSDFTIVILWSNMLIVEISDLYLWNWSQKVYYLIFGWKKDTMTIADRLIMVLCYMNFTKNLTCRLQKVYIPRFLFIKHIYLIGPYLVGPYWRKLEKKFAERADENKGRLKRGRRKLGPTKKGPTKIRAERLEKCGHKFTFSVDPLLF